jgi:predicted acylesterase/phospholipase RssA
METSIPSTKPEKPDLHVDCIKPFENIALAFSGGGFRAASFALGVLSYLNKLQFNAAADPLNGKPLLQQVTYMSSASGGTIATALYSLYNAQGKDFKNFYVKLYTSLMGEFLLQNSLEILADDKRWRNRPDKSRNVINAFSMAYDEYIFEGATLKALFYNEFKGHLQEVCFNTTEFYTGLSFRQDRKMVFDPEEDRYFKYGNENIFLDQSVAAKIKLGDALAASSCFPAGFEPIVFPEDFTHEGLNEAELKEGITLVPQTGDCGEQEFRKEKTIGFMDGGITDNQGLQSMMYADGRRINRQTSFSPFDLMLVNDVGSYFIKPYVNPPQPKHTGISLGGVKWIMITATLITFACICFGLYWGKAWLSLVGGIFIVVPALFLWAVDAVKKFIMGDGQSQSPLRKNFTEKILKLLIKYFTKTPLVVLKQMIAARADSVLLLNMSVFLKRIRQLLYNTFYDSPQWKNRGKGNHIYDLAFSSDIYRAKNPPPTPFLNPTKEIQIVAQTAFNMGTTLWFDEASTKQQHSEACIIACGQFTTCYNLLGYIEKLLLNPSVYEAVYLDRLNSLKQQLTADYTQFKADPFFMYNKDGIEYQLKDFKPLTVKDIPPPDNWNC